MRSLLHPFSSEALTKVDDIFYSLGSPGTGIIFHGRQVFIVGCWLFIVVFREARTPRPNFNPMRVSLMSQFYSALVHGSISLISSSTSVPKATTITRSIYRAPISTTPRSRSAPPITTKCLIASFYSSLTTDHIIAWVEAVLVDSKMCSLIQRSSAAGCFWVQDLEWECEEQKSSLFLFKDIGPSSSLHSQSRF